MMVGSLNPISVAFAVLFVGIGVDFGIQFSVRYRAERYEVDDLQRRALAMRRRHVGVPLTLAAAATAAGFLSFLPTDYKGVSELGADRRRRHDHRLSRQHHAAAGAAVAVQSARRKGAARLRRARAGRRVHGAAPHRHHRRHRRGRRSADCRCSISCSSTSTRSTCEARRSNRSRPISICGATRRRARMPSTCWRLRSPTARETAERLSKLPEVERVMTLDSFIPDDQDKKLALIKQAAPNARAGVQRGAAARPPTDEDNVAALNRGAEALTKRCRHADRSRRRCGQTSRRRADAARQGGPSAASARRICVRLAAQDRARRPAPVVAGGKHHG